MNESGAADLVSMCAKCLELDNKIARYHQLALRVLDAQTVGTLAKLIAEAEAEKAALHPEKKEDS